MQKEPSKWTEGRDLLAVTLALLLNQCAVIEIVYLHGTAYLVHCGGSGFAGNFATLLQNVINGRDVLLVLRSALTDGFKCVVQYAHEQLFALHVAKSATSVVFLHLCKAVVVGTVGFHLLISTEGIEVCEDGVALQMSGVAYLQVCGVGVHGFYLTANLVSGVAQVNAVSEALAHLGFSVSSGQTKAGAVLGQQDVGLHKCVTINVVETAHNLAALLQHGFLVFSYRNGCSLECCDVGSLRDGVGEEAYGNACLEVSHLDFGLHRRVALQTAHRHKVHEIERKLA